MKHPSLNRSAWSCLMMLGAVLAVSVPGLAQVVPPLSELRGDSEAVLSMDFHDAPLSIVLEHYAEIAGRTLLRSPRVPAALITLKREGVAESEFLSAIEGALAKHNVMLVPLGEEFLKVMDSREVHGQDAANAYVPAPPKDVPDDESLSQRLEMRWTNAPVSIVLDHYAEITRRTLLVSPGMPMVLITVKSNGKLSVPEFLYAIETLLAMHNIALIPLGETFLKVVPTRELLQQDKSVPIELPMVRSADADELDPHMLFLEARFIDAPLSVVLDQYADISGKTMIVSDDVPRVLITLKSKGKLSEPEFLYAIETLLTMNNIALIPEGEEILNVVPGRR